MSLSTRGRIPSLGSQYAVRQSEKGLGILLEGNPLSYHFKVPNVGGRPSNLVVYMLALQKRQYNQTILTQIDQRILQHHVKQMLEKFTPEEIIRGIHIADRFSPFPYSFAMVQRQLDHYVRPGSDQTNCKDASDSQPLRTADRQEFSVSVARQLPRQLSAF